MSNLLFTINAVMPLFVLIGLGYWMKQSKFMDEKFVGIFNTFAFQIAIPCSLFRTAYRSDIKKNFDAKLLLLNMAIIVIMITILWFVVPKLVHKKTQSAVIIQGIYRSNIVLFGLPLAENLFGVEGAAPMALIIATSVPVYNMVAVILLTLFGESENGTKPDALFLVKSVVSNKLILATLAGLIFSYFDIGLPPIVSVPLNDLAVCATPLAMISLGGQFSFQNAKGNIKLNLWTTFFRLVAVPAIVVPIVVMMGYRGADLGAIFINFTAPTATSSFIMAKNMGCDGALAGEIIVFTTLFACITVFMWVFSLKSFGLI